MYINDRLLHLPLPLLPLDLTPPLDDPPLEPPLPPLDPPWIITLLLVGLVPATILSITLLEYCLRPENFSQPAPGDFPRSSLFESYIFACRRFPLLLMRFCGFLTSSPFIRSVWRLEKLFIIERPSFAVLAEAISFLFSVSPVFCSERCVLDYHAL